MADVDRTLPLPGPGLQKSNEDALSERINIFTRSTHAQLNRLITARLPLALPPSASSASSYVTGLLHVAPIYITFESLWQTILDTPPSTASADYCTNRSNMSARFEEERRNEHVLVPHGTISTRTHLLLTRLRLPGLLRASRLRADIRTLSGLSDVEVEDHLQSISSNGALQKFLTHTTKSVRENPHVLLAYTWVMYMALFAGGRYLRAALQNAGSDFWSRLPSLALGDPYSTQMPYIDSQFFDNYVEPAVPGFKWRKLPSPPNHGHPYSAGLQFFHFSGKEDGEDIKREFKSRITEADLVLSQTEKDDIIDEAQQIFSFMLDIVGDLDQRFGTSDSQPDIVTAEGNASGTKTREHNSNCTRFSQKTGFEPNGQGHRANPDLLANIHGMMSRLVNTSEIVMPARFSVFCQRIRNATTILPSRFPRDSTSPTGTHQPLLELVKTGTVIIETWIIVSFLLMIVSFLVWYMRSY